MTTAPVFGLIFIDAPVEVIVGVAPPFHASRGGAPWGEERAQKFAEIVLSITSCCSGAWADRGAPWSGLQLNSWFSSWFCLSAP
jgi:hypothetical protein